MEAFLITRNGLLPDNLAPKRAGVSADNYKTKECVFWQQGTCSKCELCPYRHGTYDPLAPQSFCMNKLGTCGCMGNHNFKNCPENRCYYCGQNGHLRSECMFKQYNERGVSYN